MLCGARVVAHPEHLDILRALIEHGAAMNTPDIDSNISPLRRACSRNKMEAIEMLLEGGPNIEPPDLFGDRPLPRDAINLSLEVNMSALLKHDAHANSQYDELCV